MWVFMFAGTTGRGLQRVAKAMMITEERQRRRPGAEDFAVLPVPSLALLCTSPLVSRRTLAPSLIKADCASLLPGFPEGKRHAEMFWQKL